MTRIRPLRPGAPLAVAAAGLLLAGLTVAAASTGADAARSPDPASIPSWTGAVAAGDDWPQFRGPGRDGISRETGLLLDWPADGPPELWRTPLGEGYSGIAVVDGRLFTLFGDRGSEYAVALDGADGSELWRARIDRLYRDGQGNGPRATPTVHDGRAYVLSGGGHLAALDAETGLTTWEHDLPGEYDTGGPNWGWAGSPLVEGSLLLVDVGGDDGASVVAFDLETGVERWRAGDDIPGYAAPVAFTVDGLRHAVFFTGTKVQAVEPSTGRLLWTRGWETSYDVNAATPIFLPPDRLFVASGYGVGSVMLQVRVSGEESTVREMWRSSEMQNQFSSSVLVDGYLYGFNNAILMCIDAATGERMWRMRGYGHGSLIYADEHLIVLGDGGTLGLFRATPGEPAEVARVQIFQSKTWTMPTLSDGRLYARDEKEILALDLRGRETRP